ncbi:MAG: hypothetical protein VZR73_12140 [Acutalibacteraceae bacterium]|nr:hypothetical protein [Acutalibacteraceae bacterium]
MRLELISEQHIPVENAINSIQIGTLGGGNRAEPLTTMLQHMRRFKGDPYVYAVVFTDGVWNTLPIYKDMVYYNGTMRLWHYVTAHIDDPMLFDTLILSAKTDIFHPMQQALVYEAKCGRFDAAVFELP